MSVLINRETRVLVQGITGRSGALQTRVMKKYGTRVVAGVTPGKGGEVVEGIPVYDFVAEAVEQHEINAVISFVPGALARDACFEVVDSGIKFLVLTTEGIPDRDVIEIITYARSRGTMVLGSGTPGLIAPGKCKLGAHPDRMFSQGRIGVVSKSGALSYEAGKNLTEAGIGQSTVVGIGGGPVWGLTQQDIIALFQDDQETDVIVLLGEIGGSMEEEAAQFIAAQVSKPVVGLIVGRAAPNGKTLGHAGAIIEGSKGTAAAKIDALSSAGVHMARTLPEMTRVIKRIERKGKWP